MSVDRNTRISLALNIRAGRVAHRIMRLQVYGRSLGLAIPALAGLAVMPQSAEALLMSTGTPNSTYIERGAARALLPGRPVYVRVAIPNETVAYASGTWLNKDWILTAAHVVNPYFTKGATISIRLGTNLNVDLGLTLLAVEIHMFPGYSEATDTTVPDVALIKLAPNPQITSAFAGNALIDALPPEDYQTLLLAGSYGRPAQNGVFLPTSVNFIVREGTSNNVSLNLGLYNLSENLHAAIMFSSLPEEARSTPGGSGTGVKNSSNQLVGVIKGSTQSLSQAGFSFYTKIDAFLGWMYSVMLPEPPTFDSLSNTGSNFLLSVPPQSVETGYGRWTLRTSTDLGSWSGQHEFVNGVATFPMAPTGRSFYRLHFIFSQ